MFKGLVFTETGWQQFKPGMRVLTMSGWKSTKPGGKEHEVAKTYLVGKSLISEPERFKFCSPSELYNKHKSNTSDTVKNDLNFITLDLIQESEWLLQGWRGTRAQLEPGDYFYQFKVPTHQARAARNAKLYNVPSGLIIPEGVYT